MFGKKKRQIRYLNLRVGQLVSGFDSVQSRNDTLVILLQNRDTSLANRVKEITTLKEHISVLSAGRITRDQHIEAQAQIITNILSVIRCAPITKKMLRALPKDPDGAAPPWRWKAAEVRSIARILGVSSR